MKGRRQTKKPRNRRDLKTRQHLIKQKLDRVQKVFPPQKRTNGPLMPALYEPGIRAPVLDTSRWAKEWVDFKGQFL